ncbi:hypothetical protein [Streptomyces nigrescens]
MDPETFAQERLGVGDWPVEGDEWRVIGRDSWMARTDEASEPLEPMVLAIDTSPDRKYSCIAAAGLNQDGDTHVEITDCEEYDHRPGTQWVVPAVLAMWKSRRFAAVVVDKKGQAGSFIDELLAAEVTVISPNTQEFAHACGEFYSGVIPRRGEKATLVHRDQTPLTSAVAGGRQAGPKRFMGVVKALVVRGHLTARRCHLGGVGVPQARAREEDGRAGHRMAVKGRHMKRLETLVAVAVAYAMVAFGVVWQFGPYGLIAAGGVAPVALTFVDPIDMPPKKNRE